MVDFNAYLRTNINCGRATDKQQVYEKWLSAIEKDGVNLSTWEEEFVSSVRAQFDKRGFLSDKQAEIIERIYAERTG
jgi:hypothetical protein